MDVEAVIKAADKVKIMNTGRWPLVIAASKSWWSVACGSQTVRKLKGCYL